MLLFVAFFDMNFYDLSLSVIKRSYDHFFCLSLVEKLMLVTSDTEKNMLFLLLFRLTGPTVSLRSSAEAQRGMARVRARKLFGKRKNLSVFAPALTL